uniref:Sidoreflexin n=1 Tax=Timema douglasi TaxID=61478 RepID=A0A7R8VQQ9_TIMDO|nr:unnamed protein product [Timema douglasi]
MAKQGTVRLCLSSRHWREDDDTWTDVSAGSDEHGHHGLYDDILQNPHWFIDSKQQGSERIMGWCGLWKDRVVGIIFQNHVFITNLQSTPAVVFWQWVNQSFNALVNYTNRSGSSPISNMQTRHNQPVDNGEPGLINNKAIPEGELGPFDDILPTFMAARFNIAIISRSNTVQNKIMEPLISTLVVLRPIPGGRRDRNQLGTSYVLATGGALSTAIGLNSLVKSAPPLIGRWVPFVAVAAANCINIPMMRLQEIQKGVPVVDSNGNVLGESTAAAKQGIALVTMSRLGMAMPGMVLTPIVMNWLEQKKFLVRYRWAAAPIQVGLVGLCLTFATPMCCALFSQKAAIPVSSLEPELQVKIGFRSF